MTAPKTAAYVVQTDGWVAGVFLRRNDVVWLTPAQAQFENVRPAAKPAQSPARPPARKPRTRKSGGTA
jgi:hypothetical protein